MKKITLVIFMSLISFLGFAQFQEDFETGIPATWSILDNGVGLAQSWRATNSLYLPTHGGTQHALIERENIGMSNTSEDWLVTPQITVPANGQLRFWGKQVVTGNQGTLYQIRISTTSQTNQGSFTQLQQWDEDQYLSFSNYEEKVLDLTAYIGQPVYIAFVRVFTQPGTGTSGDRWLVDDVSVVSRCADPFALDAPTATISYTSASLTWSNPSGATQWEIEMVPNPGVPTGVPTATANSNPYVYTGLTPGTQYYFYVRAVCSATNTSNWAGPFIFVTKRLGRDCTGPIPITSLPYTTTDDTSLYGDDYNASAGTSCGTAGNYLNGDDVVYSYTAGFTGLLDITMTPTANASGVFVYSSCANIGVSCLAGVSNTGGGIRNIPNLAVTAGNTYYIVISTNGTPQSTGYTLVLQQVNCTQPAGLATTPITQNSATLNWTNPSGATSWEYVVQPAGTGVPLGSGTTVGATSVNVTPLTPNTQYEYYVRAECSAGVFSIWAGPFTFRTLCAPIGIPFFEGFNAVVPSASTTEFCWTVLNVGADANSWNMNYATNPFEGDQSASIVSSLATNDDWLISPQLTLNGNQRLKYRYRVQSATSACNFEVKVSTTGPVPANFTTTIVPQASYTNITYIEKVVNMVGISGDVNIGWHVAPGANGSRIYIDRVIVEDIPACPEPTLTSVTPITHNTATINWTAGGTETSWQIFVQPTGLPAPTVATQGTTVNSPSPYIATGLTGSTTYDVYVLSNCGANGPSIWVGPLTFTTQIAPPACGGTFVDAGGSTADYANNSDLTWTIYPQNPGDVVTVTFTSFNTEATWDGLYVFNGNSTAAPQIASANGAGNVPGGLAGSFWGTAIPGPFRSSAADGSLTFRFRSDSSGTRAGWVANVTCAPPPTCIEPVSISQSGITSTSVNLTWVGGNATAWEVIAVPCGSPRPTAASTGWVPAATNPFTLTGLTPTTCYDFYVRGICSPTDASAVTGPASGTTQIAPPVCGGTFVDAGGPSADYANNADVTWTICPTNPGDTVTVTFTSFNTEATWDGLYVYDGNSTAAPLLASTNGAGNVPGGLAGSYWGTTIPGPFTSSNANGCLTFRFRSDSSGTRSGWVANVTCSPAPNCTKPTTLTVSNITSTSALVGWQETGTSTQWEVFVVPFGSPAPTGTDTGILVNVNPALITGLTPSEHYSFYVRSICPTSGTSFWSTGLDFYTAPANDECTTAIFAPVNSTAVCNQTVPGSLAFATASTAPALSAPCVGTANDDVWYQFIATNPYLNVSLQNVVGSTTNLNFAVYSGSCGTLTRIFCSAANALTGTLNGLTVGQTYFIRVYSNSSAAQTSTFDLCISTPSTCATSSTVCNITYGNTTGVTSLGTIGCLSSSPNPTYFTIQVATSGPINYQLTQSTVGSPTPDLDVDYAAWGPFTSQAAGCTAISGGQPPLTGLTTGCSFSAAPIEYFNIANAVAGQFYIILITNYSNQPGVISLNQTNGTVPGAGQTICCPDANFSYVPGTYCKGSSANPVPVIATGSLAGVFSSPNPAVVFVNTATGEIDLAATPAGNYIIYNTLAAAGSCNTKTYSYVITIVNPANATISYSAPSYCNNSAGTQAVTMVGTPGGTYSVSPIGLYIDANTGTITPGSSGPGTYTVSYNFPSSSGCGVTSFTTTVTISPTPNPAPVVTQPTCIVTTGTIDVRPTAASYEYSIDNGVTFVSTNVFTSLAAGPYNVIIRDTTTGCTSSPFPVTINAVPAAPATPTIAPPVQPTCTTGGQIVVTSPTNTVVYPNLFISEVTDANTGSLTYVEIYNGTGASVNLSGYKLKFYNSLPSTTTSCNFPLSGTLANNAVYVVKVSGDANQGGIVPNMSVTTCGGVNIDDNIRLTTSADVEIDNWGRRDGIVFTPNGQTGYTYRRLANAIAPSNTWNPADWTAIDPEVYNNVGMYTPATSNYTYSVDGVTYQTSTTFPSLPPGNYNVTVQDMTTGCISPALPVTLTSPSSPTTTISYAGSPYCELAGTASVTQTGVAGGTYSSTAGLVINATTGEVDLVASTPGTYTVTYAAPATLYCTAFSVTASITIDEAPTAVISYTPAAFCSVDTTPYAVTITGTGPYIGGVYSSTAGLTIDPVTGTITPSTSTPGTYTVTYAIPANGTCASTNVTTSVTIDEMPTATIAYASPSYCSADVTVQAVILNGTGMYTGGTYSAGAGLSIDATTGAITPSTSTPGSYTVSYVIPANGSCLSATVITSVTIDEAPTAVISYTPVSFCSSDTTPYAVTITGTGLYTGGTYSATPAGLTIDPVTGTITPNTSIAGTYTVNYTIPANGSCLSTVVSTTVTVDLLPTASISYSPASLCSSVTTAQTVILTGTGAYTGGVYSSTPGLSIDATTGAVTPASSTPGTYTVTYAIPANGACASSTVTTSVTIDEAPTAIISYSAMEFCSTDATAQAVVLSGTGAYTGGTFSATAGLTIDATTGAITPSTSTPGTYTVSYAIPANGTCASTTVTTEVTINQTATVSIVHGCVNGQYTLTAEPNDASLDYVWHTATSSDVLGTNGTLVVTAAGTYVVDVTSFGSCMSSQQVVITNTICEIPKGISPNGDGRNDDFDLSTLNVTKLSIFNRYGREAFNYGSGYTNQWHGQSDSGQELPDGTYYYVIDMADGQTKTGWVYINRER